MVINKNKWHFKYYKYVKGLWNGHDQVCIYDTNLCAYVQTMIWGTFFWVLLFPLFIFQPVYYLLYGIANRFEKPTYKPTPVPFVMKSVLGAIVLFAMFACGIAATMGYTWAKVHFMAVGVILLIAIVINLLIAFKSKICPLIYFEEEGKNK